METPEIIVLEDPNIFVIPLEDDEDSFIEFFEYDGHVEVGVGTEDEGHGIRMDIDDVIRLRDWLDDILIELAE